jgi:hypothetical protein
MLDSPRLARLYIGLSKCPCIVPILGHPPCMVLIPSLSPLLVLSSWNGKREHSGARLPVLCVQRGVAMVGRVRGAHGGAARPRRCQGRGEGILTDVTKLAPDYLNCLLVSQGEAEDLLHMKVQVLAPIY